MKIHEAVHLQFLHFSVCTSRYKLKKLRDQQLIFLCSPWILIRTVHKHVCIQMYKKYIYKLIVHLNFHTSFEYIYIYVSIHIYIYERNLHGVIGKIEH